MRMDSEQTKYDRVWADFVDATETIEIFKGFVFASGCGIEFQ